MTVLVDKDDRVLLLWRHRFVQDSFVGREPEKVGEATEVNEVDRMECVPLSSVRTLIKSGDGWNSGTLVALMGLLALGG